MNTDINFVDVNATNLENELIDNFQVALNETLYSGDERRIFLLQLLPVIVGLKNSINSSAKQNLLRNATGDILDAMGEFYNCIRIAAQKATTTLRFTLSAVQSNSNIIPAGTRATPDGILYFSTIKDLLIKSGNLTGDVVAEAVETGAKYNDYSIDTIKTLVDPVPYVANVTNIDISQGGADIESDDDGINTWSGYRERIRTAPESFSTAGPDAAYKYWVKTADSNIIDVSVDSPSAGIVRIIPLLKNSEIPSQTILDKVLSIVSARDKRPLTDRVQVTAPTQVVYDISFTYYISKDNQATETTIKTAVDLAVEQYQTWQCSNLGKSINPDYLRQLVLNAKACRLNLTSPSYQTLTEEQVAKIGTVTVIYGGLE